MEPLRANLFGAGYVSRQMVEAWFTGRYQTSYLDYCGTRLVEVDRVLENMLYMENGFKPASNFSNNAGLAF